ncbi:MAG: class I SAM-dependent methyltransferase [Methanosarcina sp.]|uniref:class I SAM-dependent methyltransferase n=1 Tax=Methanosarcina sp. TaxID=2213 RepID=UPI00262661CC|nr:class I SAM-dependent methyltransferase [Methanosarcina sp.]MDD3247365.1 class I SAM-dependent methyltransferase [Methanosarcina sp.]MDD4250101.1 class I SAM-dependent methyltransferase [Methanosarcina sp.]
MNQNSESGNYKKYTSKNPLMGIVISKFMKDLSETIAPLEDLNSIIDIGCGEGFIINCLNRPDITGVDISKKALNIAKRKNPECNFCTGSVYDLSFKKNSFDLVLATEVLEHLENPEKALQEIKRISKNYCLFSVPNEPYFRTMNLLRGKNLTRFGNDIEHVQNWSSREFVKLAKTYFDVVEVKKPFPWTMVLCRK